MKKLMAFLLILFYANFAFGEYITTNVMNGCGDADVFSAMFEANTYTCSLGYYLPANTDGCAACLSGHTCSGGTFVFDKTTDQGIDYAVPIVENVTYGCADDLVYDDVVLSAIFEPNSHDCSAGQYLPAGVDACTQCPANSYCVGGTFTFDETTDQGISGQCENGYSSPAGSSSSSDCVANTITVRWDDGNGGAYTTTCTYGGALITPSTPPVAPKGYHFTGWSFNLGNN